MYRIAIPALLLAFAASSNTEAAGLNLNTTVANIAGTVPGLGNLVTSKGITLPVLGQLPGLSFTLDPAVFLLGGVNIDDITNGINVGQSGSQYAGVLGRQFQTELNLLFNK